MVKPFVFSSLPEIIFIPGFIRELPGKIAEISQSVLLVTGKSSFTGSENGQRFIETLDKMGVRVNKYVIAGEPAPADIDNAVSRFRKNSVSLVVAVGGGSVLDAGKAISAMLTVPGSVKEFLEGVGDKKHPGTKLPFYAVPTTSGTGSEATKNAVLSEVGENGFKKSLRHDNFIPDLAVLDPELMLGCPRDITAASGMDCFTQLTEAFLSDKASGFTDAFALEGFQAIKYLLVTAVENGSDLQARSGMAYAALNSGICLANAGLGTVHGFASSIGGKFEIPHGLVCGTLMASTNKINVRELKKKSQGKHSLKKYAELGKIFLKSVKGSEDYYIDGFINYLYDLTEQLEIPLLSEFGMNRSDISEIISKTANKNNPVNLGEEELEEILTERII